MDVLGNKRVAPDSWDFETHAEGPAGKIEFSAKVQSSKLSNFFILNSEFGLEATNVEKKVW